MSTLIDDLKQLQRHRAIIIKSRNMQANRLQAIVAGTLGYHSGMPEKERTAKFKEATAVINGVMAGEVQSDMEAVIRSTMAGIESFEQTKKQIETRMTKAAMGLGVHGWVKKEEQRGFGTLFLAIVVGETGDLKNYANPAKVWKRLGCAPYSFDGQTRMGSTWRFGKEGKLPAEEWEKFGYSPRRRSIAYLIGEGMVKQNKGPYRSRYDEAKKIAAEKHPEWKPARCHAHAMLLATKLFLKNLWVEWNK